MALSKMSSSDRGIISECLKAAACGPFFTDAGLRILFGLDRGELLGIAVGIHHIEDSEPVARRAIGNALMNLLMVPHIKRDEWGDWISATPRVVGQVDARWNALVPPIVFDSFQVFGPARIGERYYRVVEYCISGGGRGFGCEVWSSGRWLASNDGPGGPAIKTMVPASAAELFRDGVDYSPIRSDYDPLSVECESLLGGTSEDAERYEITTDGGEACKPGGRETWQE